MTATKIDADAILSIDEQRTRHEEKSETPIGLETEEDISQSKMKGVFSTLRMKKTSPRVVAGTSFARDLASHNTSLSEKEKSDADIVDRYIDATFAQLSYITNLSNDEIDNEITRELVTTLVRTLTAIANSPEVRCCPRRERLYCGKFKKLVDFLNNRSIF